ncbi:hypothetical protein NM688_g3564 [Phlebia brevispora]|uniref:Uncharacterized protein n=1 Tax=Phlebia brevispora TaxID=194682 RepID=A0ACC1T5F4_9APHY|nr:hypothetical protein NM688_g3564 [Phlebia brevispora]
MSSTASDASNALQSNASYLPTSSYHSRSSFFADHSDAATRPSTYNQLIDYLRTLNVAIFDPAAISLGKELGTGATFSVREAQLLNHALHNSKVAVKTPRASLHSDVNVLQHTLKEVLDEIKVMAYFRTHAHVATIRGIVLEEKGGLFLPRLIMEHAVGSFGSLLRKFKLPWSLKLKFCMETAAGLEALHSIQIVHSDVKADNILIFLSCIYQDSFLLPYLVAQVSDFGFCVPDASSRSDAASKGTLRFKAPEALPKAPPELREYANFPERDIYSFGILVWEAITNGKRPFSDVEKDDDVDELKLSSQDGAARRLVQDSDLLALSTAESPHIGVFIDVIYGTVRRHPHDGRGRMSWQKVFDTLVVAADDTCSAPNPDWTFVDYFTQWEGRQYPVSGTVYQRESWLPTAPALSSTSSDTETYAALVLQELEKGSLRDPPDWAATVRLALHCHQTGDAVGLREALDRFSRAETPVAHDAQLALGKALLQLALKVDAVEVLEALLSKGIPSDINEFDIWDLAPLHMARSAAAAEALIRRGADVNLQSDTHHFSPLHCAKSGAIADVLLQSGAKIDALDYCKHMPLHTACSGDVVYSLIRNGADPLAKDHHGDTPLHMAIQDDVALALMTACPATVKAMNASKQNALHLRADYWQANTIRCALQCGADPLSHDWLACTPIARCYSNFAAAEVLAAAVRDRGDAFKEMKPPKEGPLDRVVDPRILSLLLENGFGDMVNIPDYRGRTALAVVADRDSALLSSFSRRKNRLSPVDRYRASADFPPLGVGHLLDQSPFVHSSELTEILLKHGADPNIPDKHGDTPLHAVARNAIGYEGHDVNIGMLHLLVEAGADVSAKNSHGETPLHVARRAETVLALLEANADPMTVNAKGETAMHKLIFMGGRCKDLVSAFLKHGAKIEARDRARYTPLHVACMSSERLSKRISELVLFEQWVAQVQETRLEAITALLDHGADANAMNINYYYLEELMSTRRSIGKLEDHGGRNAGQLRDEANCE